MTEQALNRVSVHVTQPRSQGASQAMLYATGMTRRRYAEGPGGDCQCVVRRQSV